jgi:hypothetical protein
VDNILEKLGKKTASDSEENTTSESDENSAEEAE